LIVVDAADTAMENKTKKYCRKASLARGELRRLSASKDALPWNVIAGITTDKRTRSRGGGFLEDDGASESSEEVEQEQQAKDRSVDADDEDEEEKQEIKILWRSPQQRRSPSSPCTKESSWKWTTSRRQLHALHALSVESQ
jgi:hypothetical protein